MTAEQIIARTLNGTFTRVASDGEIITFVVPDDFMPDFKTSGRGIGEKLLAKRYYWTQQEDIIAAGLRRRGMNIADIAWKLSRSEEATRKRLKILKVEGKI